MTVCFPRPLPLRQSKWRRDCKKEYRRRAKFQAKVELERKEEETRNAMWDIEQEWREVRGSNSLAWRYAASRRVHVH